MFMSFLSSLPLNGSDSHAGVLWSRACINLRKTLLKRSCTVLRVRHQKRIQNFEEEGSSEALGEVKSLTWPLSCSRPWCSRPWTLSCSRPWPLSCSRPWPLSCSHPWPLSCSRPWPLSCSRPSLLSCSRPWSLL